MVAAKMPEFAAISTPDTPAIANLSRDQRFCRYGFRAKTYTTVRPKPQHTDSTQMGGQRSWCDGGGGGGGEARQRRRVE